MDTRNSTEFLVSRNYVTLEKGKATFPRLIYLSQNAFSLSIRGLCVECGLVFAESAIPIVGSKSTAPIVAVKG